MADRGRAGVDAAGGEVVAGVAADDLARRKARIEEQELAKIDLLMRHRVVLDGGHDGRDRLEILQRSFHQIVVGPDRRRGKSQDGSDRAGNGIAHFDKDTPFLALPDETCMGLQWMACIRRQSTQFSTLFQGTPL